MKCGCTRIFLLFDDDWDEMKLLVNALNHLSSLRRREIPVRFRSDALCGQYSCKSRTAWIFRISIIHSSSYVSTCENIHIRESRIIKALWSLVPFPLIFIWQRLFYQMHWFLPVFCSKGRGRFALTRVARAAARVRIARVHLFSRRRSVKLFRERKLRWAVHAAERPDSKSPSEFRSGKQKTAAFELAALGRYSFLVVVVVDKWWGF